MKAFINLNIIFFIVITKVSALSPVSSYNDIILSVEKNKNSMNKILSHVLPGDLLINGDINTIAKQACYKYIFDDKKARRNYSLIYLRDLLIEDFPEDYSTINGLRPQKTIPDNFPTNFNDAQKMLSVDVDLLETDIFLLSHTTNGTKKFPRLGKLEHDGRPVVVLTYKNQDYENEFLFDFKAAMIADALGIGPKFHGSYQDKNGNFHLVMDIIPGDFPGSNKNHISEITVNDIDEIYSRINKANLNISIEFQYFVTNNDHALLLDCSSILEKTTDDGNENMFLCILLWLLDDLTKPLPGLLAIYSAHERNILSENKDPYISSDKYKSMYDKALSAA